MQPINQQSNKSYNLYNKDTYPANHILAFSDIKLFTEDFTNVGRQATWFLLDKCVSDKWEQILQRVVDLTEVMQLSIMRCGLPDKHL
jgi:hypothetical protein